MSISPKVLRHFATLTIAITALIGVFAHGENNSAAAAKKTGASEAKSDGVSISSFGEAEKQALKGGEKQHNGLVIAKGTKINSGGGGYEESGGGDGGGGGGGGDDSSYDPQSAAISADTTYKAAPGPANAAAPQEIARDASGIPIKLGNTRPRATNVRTQPPGPATTTQVEQMLAASRARSGSDRPSAQDDDGI